MENNVQPGTDVLAGKFLHPTTGAVEDTDTTGSGTAVAKDSIKFTYFIHHQRFEIIIVNFFNSTFVDSI